VQDIEKNMPCQDVKYDSDTTIGVLKSITLTYQYVATVKMPKKSF